MGLSFRRSIGLGRLGRMNISKRGVSVSEHLGPVTINSRGRFSIRLGKGLSWRGKL